MDCCYCMPVSAVITLMLSTTEGIQVENSVNML